MTLPATVKTNEENTEHDCSWSENASVQKLLDVIVLILMDNYIQTVRTHPTLFSDNGNSQ